MEHPTNQTQTNTADTAAKSAEHTAGQNNRDSNHRPKPSNFDCSSESADRTKNEPKDNVLGDPSWKSTPPTRTSNSQNSTPSPAAEPVSDHMANNATPNTVQDIAAFQSKPRRIALLCYLIVTAATFPALLLAPAAGISVALFTLIQFAFACFLLPNKRALILFVPLFAISLNSFLSMSSAFRFTNGLATLLLCGMLAYMGSGAKLFSASGASLAFFGRAFPALGRPFLYLGFPFRWISHRQSGAGRIVGRVLLALVIAAPCLLVISLLLASADQVFSYQASALFGSILRGLRFSNLLRTLFGVCMGFYLFGLLASSYRIPKQSPESAAKEKRGDPLILNIFLGLIVAIYTVFVFIQLRYLFLKTELPYGLTYAEYARTGFFQLLFLTFVNVFLILLAARFYKTWQGHATTVSKTLCCLLCALTVGLLVSSFYRMQLYSEASGLTFLRLLVMLFLAFEAAGLLATFVYILKPHFNILALYFACALLYYSTINVVPLDNIIAKNQVDRYLAGQSDSQTLHYITHLSFDAAPQVARLAVLSNDATREIVSYFFDHKAAALEKNRSGWRSYNLSYQRGMQFKADSPQPLLSSTEPFESSTQ